MHQLLANSRELLLRVPNFPSAGCQNSLGGNENSSARAHRLKALLSVGFAAKFVVGWHIVDGLDSKLKSNCEILFKSTLIFRDIDLV